MAKKVTKLEFIDIVMGADSEVIKQALEARLKIDDQLEIRRKAYEQIAAIEQEVESIVGVEGEFVFPAPPLQVAGFTKLIPASRTIPRPATPAVKKTEKPVKPVPTETESPKSEPKADNK